MKLKKKQRTPAVKRLASKAQKITQTCQGKELVQNILNTEEKNSDKTNLQDRIAFAVAAFKSMKDKGVLPVDLDDLDIQQTDLSQWALELKPNAANADSQAWAILSPLAMAAFIAKLHLDLLKQDTLDTFFDSATAESMGNTVLEISIKNGVNLNDDDGYCLKATPIEVCQYTVERLKAYAEEHSSDDDTIDPIEKLKDQPHG